MTDEQIRIAIAEACGWHEEKEPVGSANATAWWHYNDRYPSYLMPVPDYLNDLNAMHEAEQTLWRMDWRFRDEFIDHLARVINPIHGYRMQEGIDLLDATAAQRAEAFLRTLGKWEETK